MLTPTGLFPVLSFVAATFAQDVYPVRQYSVGVFPQLALINDIDGDGKADLVVANKTSNFVSVLKGAGNATFANAPNIPLATAAGVTMALADFSGDGNTDIVSGGSTILQIVKGTGGGAFAAAQTIGAGGTPVSVAVGNVNGDMFPDLIVATAIGAISVHAGLGGGTFAPPVI